MRGPAVALVAFVLGVGAGAGAVVWRQSGPESTPFRVDEHAVELVLFQEVQDRSRSTETRSEVGPLRVDSAVLLSGLVTSTVLSVRASGGGLAVRVPALPVTVSPAARLRKVVVEVDVRDCEAAVRWIPEGRPFIVTWRDEYGRVHMDRAGDFGPSMGDSFTDYLDAACDGG